MFCEILAPYSKRSRLSVTFLFPQMIVAAMAFMANARFPKPSTSLVVKVMGNVLSHGLFDECDIRTADGGSFLRHLFIVTFAKYSSGSIPRTPKTAKWGKGLSQVSLDRWSFCLNLSVDLTRRQVDLPKGVWYALNSALVQ